MAGSPTRCSTSLGGWESADRQDPSRARALVVPLTRAQYNNSNKKLYPQPPKLFSHNDQQSIWQSSSPEGSTVGWGGNLGDLALSQKGVCRHRAFAFLVTALYLGIPTRVVDGLAYTNRYAGVDHVFVPHAWAQAYVDGGPADGNAMMPRFDEESDKLQEIVDQLLSLSDQTVSDTAGRLRQTVASIQAEGDQLVTIGGEGETAPAPA